MKLTQILILISVFPYMAISQDHPKKHFIDSEGKLFWNKDMPVYLMASSSPDDKGVLLKSENQSRYTNPLFLDTEGVNYIRTNWAVDQETKQQVQPKVEVTWEIYADGAAPNCALAFKDAPRHSAGGINYYGQNLKLELTAIDRYSGVNKILTSGAKQGAFSDYSKPLDYKTEGEFDFRYYAVDNVGNAADPKTSSFVVDLTPPESFHNVNGITEDQIIATSSTIYLSVNDALSGNKVTYVKFDDEEFREYNGRGITFDYLEDGTHILSYYSIDNVDNEESVKTFEFYYDKTAPIMAADVLGDRFIVDDKVYFSGRTKLKLTAVDNKSGVKEILYSIDEADYETYTEPFYLPSVAGNHSVRYYSLDELENQYQSATGNAGFEEFKHNVSKVYVDLTGPLLSHNITGPSYLFRDTIFVNSKTKIQLRANDGESGLQKITYSIDGEIEETDYQSPFSVTGSGLHRIEYFGYDNVNNRNIGNFSLISDDTAPDIFIHYSINPIGQKEGLDVYPSNVNLFLSATDLKTGADKIFYTINGGSERLSDGRVENLAANKKFEFNIRALDKLGNESSKTITFFTAE
ncbi:MAG: hypothetical protein RJQ09_04365 [Cyclobacteriaceae bacterium]